MIIEVTIPTPGESISEVDLASWLVEDGDIVKKDQEIAEIESDKATLPLIAEKGGKIKIMVSEGETIKVGTVACTIDTSQESSGNNGEPEKESKQNEKEVKKEKEPEAKKEVPKSEPETKKEVPKSEPEAKKPAPEPDVKHEDVKVTPVARKMMEAEGLSIDDILKGLKKITSKEVNMVAGNHDIQPVSPKSEPASRDINRESLSQLRKKLAKRLVAVKNETAMLTTFNEVDMSEVIRIRKQYQKQFTDTHGVKLGFMSFFVKAVTEALKTYPKVNSMLDGDEMLVPDFVDISIAVQTEKGLMVPVLRNTETMSLAEIENKIIELATKARKFRLSIDEMTGGTFSITNGGIFGSMLSTPIINPPQSGILGMHNIVERPVAVNGKVEIRPIMYVALSYDHRIIDGRDSVSFLVKVKELIEAPHKMLYGGKDPEGMLLGI